MISLVAVVLVLVTGLSVWLAEDLAGDGVPGSALVMTIVAFKLRLVGLYFMELRHAPLTLKLLFHAWVVGVWGIIVGFQMAG
ncbi:MULTISPECIES: cytochrome C oxidase subunit IV family protein [Parafrankia]|uniref:cytochrome C oxidase subunit IV family protein n=1 Tax=Parafrankia TaxID=2994362 RepID=UPI0013F4C668|nr:MULTISPECIES: cytochrome C oxidase subunit IV family protein [Parafrankia]MBE3200316.1 cytochrome C oxidase subunit IV family protein [Parafrankia sp. CH37]